MLAYFWPEKHKFKLTWQGVVTLIGPVEPFATGIKMKSSDQEAPKSSDQGVFQIANQEA